MPKSSNKNFSNDLMIHIKSTFKQYKDLLQKFENLDTFSNYVESFESGNKILLIRFLNEINVIKNIFPKLHGGALRLNETVSINRNVKMQIVALLTLYKDKCRRWYEKDNDSPYREMFFNYYVNFFGIKMTKEKLGKSSPLDGGDR